jgi:RNA recognition motif-containing protein
LNTKLYVGNLPYETTEQDLQALFEGMGPIARITVMKDRDTGRARGFAFVEMNSEDGARRAISELDQQPYGGRNLTVNEAKPMAARGGGGDGRRDRRPERW